MADHRKSLAQRRFLREPRFPRRGGVLRWIQVGVLVLAFAPCAAQAQELGLKRGEASLNSGNAQLAIQQLSATVNNDKSTPGQAARALYLRGIAFRRIGQPARAISDLGAAVWMGLPSSDKARALVNKSLAFQAVGMPSQANAAMSQARRLTGASEIQRLIAQDGANTVANADPDDLGGSSASGSVWDRIVPSFGSSGTPEPASESTAAQAVASETQAAAEPAAAPSSGWDTSVKNEAAPQSGNAVSRWFGSLAGGSSSDTTVASTATSPAPTAAPTTRSAPSSQPAAAPPSADSWAANTETQSGEGGTAVGRWFSRQTTSAPAESPPAAGYTVQLANSQSRAEAQGLWNKVKAGSPQLASASPRIEQVDIGGLGTFYTVKFGPFATQSQGAKVCNSLKRRGTDCSVIAPGGP